MRFLMRVVSDLSKLNAIGDEWDAFVEEYSPNPFFLRGFMKKLIEFNQLKRGTSLILVFSVDNNIVGILPLKITQKFGIRFVKFLPSTWFSPDLITNNQYREICISYTLDFLFKTLRCQFVDLVLPSDSYSLPIIKQKCEINKIPFSTKPEMGRRILPVQGTWTEFETFRGRNFKRKFKKIKHSLDRLGSWKTLCAENGHEDFDVVQKVLDIEKMSWKEERRLQTGQEDSDLSMILEASQHTVGIEPSFNWEVCFLELNSQAIAYSLFINYKGVSYCVKTSYDRRYKRVYPGIFVINAAICEFFNGSQIRKVDFLTDLPFHETWASLYSPRVRIIMSRNRVLLSAANIVFLSKPARGFFALLSKIVPSITSSIGL